ncbi:32076_t:CDS:2, partial [Racocetra persica]
MKSNTVDSCIASDDSDDINCERKANFDIYAGLVVFGTQEIILVVLGLLVWFCAKRISKKPINKEKRKSERKETKEIDMEVQETHVADAASTLSIDVLEKRQYMDQESLIANPPSPFIRRPTQSQRQENQIPNETTPEYNRTPGNSRIQENQGNLRIQENQGNLRIQENQGNLRMQENQGNSRITQSTQG